MCRPNLTLTQRLVKRVLAPFARPFTSMPGQSFAGEPKPLSRDQLLLKDRLRLHIEKIAVQIGERSPKYPERIEFCENYIAAQFALAGLSVSSQAFEFAGLTMHNIIAEIKGSAYNGEVIVIGAHYDSIGPGANDNTSGVSALIEIARHFAKLPYKNRPKQTIRFVAFANEEDSGEAWQNMGSYHYAKLCKARRENIVGMISLEMLGCFLHEHGSQKYPFPFNLFYPDKGNFIGFVANRASLAFVKDVIGKFRQVAQFPSEGVAAPEIFADISRSDHWSFWQFGYPALMVTDTSNFRFQHLHLDSDTPDKIDFDSMTRIVDAMVEVVAHLANK